MLGRMTERLPSKPFLFCLLLSRRLADADRAMLLPLGLDEAWFVVGGSRQMAPVAVDRGGGGRLRGGDWSVDGRTWGAVMSHLGGFVEGIAGYQTLITPYSNLCIYCVPTTVSIHRQCGNYQHLKV
jgi:hypothetical protein